MADHREGGGCGRTLLIGALLLWFGVAPMTAAFAVNGILDGVVGTATLQTLAILAAALVTLVPFSTVALVASGRGRRGAIAATAGSLAIASGYVVLEAAIRVVVPHSGVLVPLWSRYAAAGLRLAIIAPYALAAAWLAGRLAGQADRPMRDWLGLHRPRWSTVWLSLATAAVITVPWPVTGALGDSLTTLAMAVELISAVISALLVFWGVVFVLLTASSLGTTRAAILTVLIYALSALAGVLPGGDVVDATRSLFVLPVAFLLTELRARGGSVLPLLPLAVAYRLVPLLFVDARDVIASGIPEPQHILSYLAVIIGAWVLAIVLWMGRRASQRRTGGTGTHRGRRHGRRSAGVAALAAMGWILWIGLYVVAGEPGFFNDGFLIILRKQADLGGASQVTGREERLEAVYAALVETAKPSQESIRDELDGLNVPYRRYYIINMIRVDGHRWLMDRFTNHPDVAEVVLNPNVRKYPRRITLPYGAGGDDEDLQGNLAAIRVEEAWELGVGGRGIVVGGQDTGYAWDHPALKNQYRGWNGDHVEHAYNWHDAWDGRREPFDDGAHGTHTMGTVLGSDGGANATGVAPEATWIGCRNMRRGFGNPGSYAECMEFLFAPYAPDGDPFEDGDVRMGAQVINNSWGCPDIEGCFPETLRPAVEALRAAGVMMVVSAGNDGPACNTATTSPANYDAAFTVGATTEGGEVVGFSSRGPVAGLIKPDIAAPGQQVRSSVPGGGYGTAGGTSMAAPHVAGAVALIWAADGNLVGDIGATEELLCRTAVPKPVSQSCSVVPVPEGPFAAVMMPPACACGGVSGVPNNVYGCGFLDAGAAVEAALGQ